MRQVSLHGPKIIKSHCHNILFLALQLTQHHWTEVEHTSTSLYNLFLVAKHKNVYSKSSVNSTCMNTGTLLLLSWERVDIYSRIFLP